MQIWSCVSIKSVTPNLESKVQGTVTVHQKCCVEIISLKFHQKCEKMLTNCRRLRFIFTNFFDILLNAETLNQYFEAIASNLITFHICRGCFDK